ncbi:MAG: transcription antitermination factor NusB [Vallitaleaceae bacterium]|nr:transcription antitermination factor NusB [Vallitaleaceae bacterium]
MNRHRQRESTFRIVFSMDINKSDNTEEDLRVYLESLELAEEEDRELIVRRCLRLIENQEAIDKMIVACTQNWEVDRIGKIELAILRVAVFEMLYDEMPVSVAINEAVELAKKYGEDHSSKFVNGVLGQVAKRLV